MNEGQVLFTPAGRDEFKKYVGENYIPAERGFLDNIEGHALTDDQALATVMERRGTVSLELAQERIMNLTLIQRAEMVLDHVSRALNHNGDAAMYRSTVDQVLGEVKKAREEGLKKLEETPENRRNVPPIGTYDASKRIRH